MKLHSEIIENSGQTVVFLHGFLSSSDYWKGKIIEEASRTRRIVLIDLLGFGRSPMPNKSLYDAEAHISALHHTLSPLLSDGPCVLVGHSMGAIIAALYAKKYPQNVKKLIALNPPMFKNKAEARSSIQNTNIFYRLFLYSKLQFIAPLALWLIAKLVGKAPKGRLKNIPLLEQGFKKSTRHSRRRSLMAIIEGEAFLEITRQSSVPTSVLVGSRDRQEYLKNLQLISLPKFVQVRIIDCGHHIPTKRPDIVISEITDI